MLKEILYSGRRRSSPRSIPLSLFVSVVLALFLLAGAGCAVRKHAKVPGVTTSVDQPDIPVPDDFRREKSFSYGEFSFRSWYGEYVGRTKRRELENWYRPRMQREGWLLRNTQVGAKTRLVYTKGTEEQAVLTFTEEFFPEEDRYNTVVRAEIKPLAPDALQVEDVVPSAAISVNDEFPEAGAVPASDSSISPVRRTPDAQESEDDAETGGLLPRS